MHAVLMCLIALQSTGKTEAFQYSGSELVEARKELGIEGRADLSEREDLCNLLSNEDADRGDKDVIKRAYYPRHSTLQQLKPLRRGGGK